MHTFLLFTFTLLLTGLSAQPKFQYYYSIFDSCPSPATHHIALRTITVNDSFTGNLMTRTEYYNTQGKIIRVTDVSYGEQWKNGEYKSTTFFTYDERGRIAGDSTACDSLPWMKSNRCVDKYSYDAVARCIKKHMDSFGYSMAQLSYYDTNNKFYAFDVIDPHGDTSQRAFTHGDTTTTLNHFPDQNGKSYLHDSSILINSPTYANYFYWHIDRPSQRIVKYYNKSHQLIDEVNFTNEVLTDSTHNTYSKGKRSRLTESTRMRFPNEHLWFDTVQVTWHSQYTYDKKGNLVEVKTYSDNPKDNIWFTRYTYNEKGLRSAKMEVEVVEGKESVRKEEAWNYEHY